MIQEKSSQQLLFEYISIKVISVVSEKLILINLNKMKKYYNKYFKINVAITYKNSC